MLPVLAALLAAGCGGRARVQVPPPGSYDAVAALRDDLDRIFSDATFSSAQWGVEVLSLDRGEMIYERNSGKLYMPASNNKLLTGAAALVGLGPDFRFETPVAADGRIAEGILNGNLIVFGSGDPSLSPHFWNGDPLLAFRGWAAHLKENGIRTIKGDIIGVDGNSGTSMLGSGWAWDDLPYGYAAPVSALQFNDNLITVEVSPGAVEGDPGGAKVLSPGEQSSVDCRVVTGAPGSDPDLRVDHDPGAEAAVLRGRIPLKSPPIKQAVAVAAPARFFLRALKQALHSEGIDVSACSERVVRTSPSASATTLWTHRSPPLAEVLQPLLKISQNLYAETLARTLGQQRSGEWSHARGREAVQEALSAMALEPGSYFYADGSGLSRRNLVSPDQLVRLLKFMSRHQWFTAFYDALPVAGVDGTIQDRMKGTKAEGNVRAKTGTLANVRCLSGYVRTADGELLAFSMMANNFLTSNRSAEHLQDSALERIAAFSRR